MLAIFKREFKSYFQNVVGWLFTAALLSLYGLYFAVTNMLNGKATTSTTLSSIAYLLIILVPILSMRSLSEDRRNKTDQLTLTAPISLGKVILGKYLAMVAIFTIDVAVFALSPLYLRCFGTVDFASSYVFLLGFWLYGCTSIAIGLFFSSITESQVIAAVSSVAALFLAYMMSGIRGMLPDTASNWIGKVGVFLSNVLGCYDLYTPLNSFADATIDITSVVYFVTVSALFLFLTTQVIQKRRWTVSRDKVGTGVFSVGMILVSIAVVVVANIGIKAVPTRYTSFDVSADKLTKITEETQEFLADLDEDVTLYYLGTEDDSNTYAATFLKTLKRYEGYSSHITLEYVDPSVNANFYTAYTDTAPSQYSVIVVSDKRSTVIDFGNDVYDYEMDYTTYSTTVTGYDGEGQLDSAIQYVTLDSESMPNAYEVTGHNETSLSGNFTDSLSKANINVTELTLLENDAVPDDCDLLIINGPTTDFSEDDAQKVIDYIENGGQVMINLNLNATEELPNLNSILTAYGMSMKTGLVCEQSADQYYQYQYYLLPAVDSSDYTSNASSNHIFIPLSEAIEVGEDTDDISYTTILETSEDAILKTDFANMQEASELSTVADGDETGQFVLAAAAETTDGGRLIVNGSYVTFTDDADSVVSNNNSTYFMDIVNATVDSDSVKSVVIDVKPYDSQTLTITTLAFVLTMLGDIAIFLVMLAAGIITWAVRRRK